MIIDLQQVAKRTARIMRLGGTPEMRVLDCKRGIAHPDNGYFVIPKWATQRHPAYAIAYVIHELSHFAKSQWRPGEWYLRGHGPAQRKYENEAAEAFGLRLSYIGMKCYASRIIHLESRRTLCERYGEVFTFEADCEHPACLI